MLIIAIHGTAVTLGALEVSRVADGMIEAAAFLFALFTGVVTMGLMTAALLDARLCRVRRWSADGAARECGWCGRQMKLHQSIWVCDFCDGHRHPHREGDHRARA